MKTVFRVVLLMLVAANSRVSGKPTIENIVEKVRSLADTIHANGPPYGLLFWSGGGVSTSATPAPPAVPAGYEHQPGFGYYKLHDYAATWRRASQVCTEEGAHLLILNSEAESEMAQALMARYPIIRGVTAEDQDWFWIGIQENGIQGEFYTIQGDPLASTGFTRWDLPHPNAPGTNDCGMLYRKTGGLADDPCQTQLGFICEY